jgi:GDP-L-fucose synthase
LAGTIAKLVGYTGEIRWDPSQPDGQPRRRLDTSKAKTLFGFEARTSFEEGLHRTIAWYRGIRRYERLRESARTAPRPRQAVAEQRGVRVA